MLDTWNYNEIQDEVIKYWNTEAELFSTCHDPIDEYYKVLLGNCTDITGYPYSGKTLFLIDILFNLSKSKGFKHLLHLPDSGKPAEVIANLIHKYTGKSFNKEHKNAIEEHEIIKCMGWINQHFQILKYNQRPTPVEFWEYANTLDIQTASIDSWNYMKHESSGTDYLAQMLSSRNELAEKGNKHFFTVIHPKNPTQTDYDKNGIIKPPDVFNLMGGSEWNNNGKNIIAIHKESKESMNYDVYIRKTKPRIVGKTGFVTMQYDIKLQRFYNIMKGFSEYANYDETVKISGKELDFEDADEFF